MEKDFAVSRESVNLPDESDDVCDVDPLTITVAPATGSLVVSSTILPFTLV